MIIKERNVPIKIKKMEALLRRLPRGHQKRPEIEAELAKRKAGFRGEQSIDFHLSFLPNNKYFIFNDIRLPWKESYTFQIDILLISQNFALIIEVKNIAGSLYFDNIFNQMIRTINEKEEGFPDPVLQARRHQYQLLTWLAENRFNNLPVEYLIIISNPSTIIKADIKRTHYLRKVFHSADLINQIHKFENSYKESALQPKEIRKLNKLLLKNDTPENPDILHTFSIPKKDVLTGVQCIECSYLPMKREHGKWACPICNFSDKHAHIEALADFILLNHSDLTIQEARSYLHLSSRHTAKRILNSVSSHHSPE